MTRQKKPNLFIATNIQSAMSGTGVCRISKGIATLEYHDGTTESAPMKHPLMQSCDWGNWFSIVGCIQAVARS